MDMFKFEKKLAKLIDRARAQANDGPEDISTTEIARQLLSESHELVPPMPAPLVERTPLDSLKEAFGEMPLAAGDVFRVTIGDEGTDFTVSPNFDHYDALIREAATLFDGYAKHHLAKTPADIGKAARNVRMAVKLFEGVDEPYTPPELPEERPETAQESDSGLPAPQAPAKLSDAPMDRAEAVAWLDGKLEGLAKHGMRETYNVVQAIRQEIAQHIEAAPIDFQATLRAFYLDVYHRNVKAGWWSDLVTGKPKKRSVSELFVLFVTELAEAWDAYLTGAADDKLPQYPGLGVELGDLQIRFADFCGALAEGNIVEDTDTFNPANEMMADIAKIANRYERIRKTDAAKGDEERGDFLPPADVAEMVVEKLAFNAQRADHKIENRMKPDGKRT